MARIKGISVLLLETPLTRSKYISPHTHTHTHNVLRDHWEPSAHSRTNKPFTVITRGPKSSKATHTHMHTPFKAFLTRNSAWLSQRGPCLRYIFEANTSSLLRESQNQPIRTAFRRTGTFSLKDRVTHNIKDTEIASFHNLKEATSSWLLKGPSFTVRAA